MGLRIRLITILLLISSIVSAQLAPNVVDNNGLKQGVWEKIENGQIVYSGTFRDGKPIGEFKRNKNGVLRSVQYFFEGSDISSIELYDSNGILLSKGQYNGHVKDSIWEYYSKSGVIIRRENYVAGQLDGERLIYDPNGGIMDNTYWKNGKESGERKMYYTQGEIEVRCNYLAGKLNGSYFSYYDNGKERIIGSYDNGKKVGTWKYYYKPDGVVSSEVKYIDGVQQGGDEDLQKKLEAYENKHLKDPANYVNNPDSYMYGSDE